jgi:hypothetical protein
MALAMYDRITEPRECEAGFPYVEGYWPGGGLGKPIEAQTPLHPGYSWDWKFSIF